MKYSVEHKLFIYDNFVQRFAWMKCRRKYPDDKVPCKATIHSIVTELHSSLSVMDKKKSRKRHIMAQEKLDDIGTRLLEVSPKKSLHLLAPQCGLAKSKAHVGTKLPVLRPYKITIVHSLLPPYCEGRIRYCRWFQESVFN
jgi:hypothetical protein